MLVLSRIGILRLASINIGKVYLPDLQCEHTYSLTSWQQVNSATFQIFISESQHLNIKHICCLTTKQISDFHQNHYKVLLCNKAIRSRQKN